jgi:hypothetical protein
MFKNVLGVCSYTWCLGSSIIVFGSSLRLALMGSSSTPKLRRRHVELVGSSVTPSLGTWHPWTHAANAKHLHGVLGVRHTLDVHGLRPYS